MSFRTNALKVQAFAGAVYGIQVGTTTMAQINADITSAGGLSNALNGYYASSFGSVANATVATTIATNLGLTGDALTSGAAYITAQLNAAAPAARGAVISNILDLFAGLTADATFGAFATAYNAKVDAATAYTGSANVAIGSTVGTGSTFTLTANTDNIVGTSGNDAITGSSSTFNSDDVINGGAGTDTLSITAAGNGSVIANLTSVETVKVTNGGANTTSYDLNMIGATGATELQSRLSSGNVSFTNVQAAATVSAYGTTDGKVTATFLNSLASGTADSVTVKLDGGATSAFDVKGTGSGVFETVNIQSAGSNKNSVTFASTTEAGADKYVVTGAAAIDVALTVPKAKAAFDASAVTGAVKLTLADDDGGSNSTGQNVDVIKTGSGDDTVDLTAVVGTATATSSSVTGFFDQTDGTASKNGQATAKTIDLGAGSNTLVINENLLALGAAADASGNATKHSLTNVTTLQVKATADRTVDGGAFGGAIAFVDGTGSAAGNVTFTAQNLAAGQTVSVKTGTVTTADSVAVGLKTNTGTADNIQITLDDAKLATVSTLGSSGAINETVTLTTANKASTIVKFDGDVSSGAKVNTLTIVGNQDLTIGGSSGGIDLVKASGATTATVDASGFTGKLTLGTSSVGFKSSSDALTVKLGSGNDTIYAAQTLTDTDVIDGTAGGTDTVYLAVPASSGTLKTTIKNVSNVVAASVATNTGTLDVTNFSGVGKIQLVDAGVGLIVSNIASGQAIDIKGGSSADFSSNTVTLTNATGVTSAAVTLSNDTAFAGTLSTNATSLTITDKSADANGKAINNGVILQESAGKVTSLTVVGGGKTGATPSVNSVFTVNGDGNSTTKLATLDATGYAGDITLGSSLDLEATKAAIKLGSAGVTLSVRAADLARDAIVVTGGAGSDTLKATLADLAAATTYRPGASGVEAVALTLNSGTSGSGYLATFDLQDTSGIDTVSVDFNATDDTLTVDNASTVKTVKLVGQGAGATTIAKATDLTVISTGAVNSSTARDFTADDATSLVVKQGAASSGIKIATLSAAKATSVTIGGADKDSAGTEYAGAIAVTSLSAAEMTSLKVDSNDGAVTISNLTAAKLAAVTVVGDNAVSFGGSSTTTAVLASFDASAATAAVTVAQGVDFTSSATVKLGSGDDTITLDILTEGGLTVDGGTKSGTTGDSDMLKLAGTNNLGLSVIDLSAADHVSQLNGALNSAVQSNFESIDLSGLTGSFGANITGSAAANTIAGTKNADNIVFAGAATVDTLLLTSDMGTDTVSGLKLSGTVVDKLDVTTNSLTGTTSLAKHSTGAIALGTSAVDVDGNRVVYVKATEAAIDEATEIDAEFAATSKTFLSMESGDAFVIFAGADNDASIHAYKVAFDNSDTNKTVVTKIGVIELSSGDIDDFFGLSIG